MAAAAMKKQEGDATVHRLVVGMGKTGFSLAMWLARNGHAFAAVDSRADPPLAERFHRELPDHVLHTGGFDASLLALLSRLFGCLRPGDNLCPGGLTSFRRRLAYATSRLGASSIGITAGSFRAGGATYSFECGMDLAEIQHRGRWDNSRTLSHYIQSANAAIAFSKLDVATSKHIAQVGTFFSALIEGADAASQPSG